MCTPTAGKWLHEAVELVRGQYTHHGSFPMVGTGTSPWPSARLRQAPHRDSASFGGLHDLVHHDLVGETEQRNQGLIDTGRNQVKLGLMVNGDG